MKSVEFIEQLKVLVANEDPLSVSNDINDLKAKFNDFTLEEERKAQVAQLTAEKVEANIEAVNAIETPISEGDPIIIESTNEVEVVTEEDQVEVSTEAPTEEAAVAEQITDAITLEEPEVTSNNEGESTALSSAKDEFYAIYNEYKTKKKAVIDERNATEASNLQEKKALITKLREVVTTEENIGSAFASFKEIQEKWKSIGDIPRAKRNDVQAEYSKLLEAVF